MLSHFKQEKNQHRYFLLIILAIALAAAIYVWFCTRVAPWGFSDTAAYFSTARNFAAGKGFGIYNADGSFTRLTIFAPLFPFVLSGFVRLGIDLVAATRWMDIFFFALLVFLSGWLFFKITKSRLFGAFLVLMIGTTLALATDFTSMMSEPLGVLLCVCGLLLLVLAIQQTSRKWLILAAILSALAVFSRYALVAVPIAGVLILLVISYGSWKKRFKDALIYGAIAVGPMILWLLPEFLKKASFGNRQIQTSIAYPERILAYFKQLITVLKYWLPYRTNMIPGLRAGIFTPVLLFVFTGVIAVGLFLAFKKYRKDADFRPAVGLIWGTVIFLAVYILVLLFAFVFTNSVDINDRMLSPTAPFLYALLLASILIIGQSVKRKKIPAICGLIVTLFFVVFSFIPLRTYLIFSAYPDGYASPTWQQRAVMAKIDQLPEGTSILSNAPNVILFYTNRSAYRLSNLPQSSGTKISADDEATFNRLVGQQCGVIVIFKPGDADSYEHFSDAIDSAQIEKLSQQYVTTYADPKDQILIDKNCRSKLGY
jgi:hypothetical protein